MTGVKMEDPTVRTREQKNSYIDDVGSGAGASVSIASLGVIQVGKQEARPLDSLDLPMRRVIRRQFRKIKSTACTGGVVITVAKSGSGYVLPMTLHSLHAPLIVITYFDTPNALPRRRLP